MDRSAGTPAAAEESAWEARHRRLPLRILDESVQSFVALDDRRLAAAPGGELSGLVFGVKDLIDVAGLPTRAGSLTREHAPVAAADAEVVARLRAAGATPIGKTTTTEFAFVDPTQTRNPWNLAHSPGGSSSGSGAAVAAGFVDFALGTQTAGSLCRPAAYCGVAAIKPSYGMVPTAGLVALSPSFDTIGVIAPTVARAAEALEVMAPGAFAGWSGDLPGMVLATPTGGIYDGSTERVAAFHLRTAAAVRAAGGSVVDVAAPFDPSIVISDHRVVMLHEAFAQHGHLLARPHLIGPRFREGLEIGRSISVQRAADARSRLELARDRVWRALDGFDGLLLQPVPDTAPMGLETTGDQSYLTPWTAFGGPLVVVPGELSTEGLPLAAMVAAAPGRDRVAIGIGIALQAIIDRVPRPAPVRA